MIEKEFDEKLRSIVQMGYSLILISHETFINPEEENGIKKAAPTLSKRPKKICSRLVDNFIYITMEATPDGSLERVMHFRETPMWEAGSRFKYMPESCPLGYGSYKEAVVDAITKMEQESGEEYVTAAYVNNYSLQETPSFDELMTNINDQINKIMALVQEEGTEAEIIKSREQIVKTIEKRLGQGRKLANATENQIEQLVLLQDDFKEILEA